MLLGEGVLELAVDVRGEVAGVVNVLGKRGLRGGSDGLEKRIAIAVNALGILGTNPLDRAVEGGLLVGEVTIESQTIVKEFGVEGGRVAEHLIDCRHSTAAVEKVSDGVDSAVRDAAVLIVNR